MADRFDWNVVLRIAMDGGPQTKRELDTLTKAQALLDGQSKKTTDTVQKQGTAMRAAGRDFASLEKQANSLRYANYDLAQTFLGLSAGITAAGTATVVAFAKQERAFTDVQRTAEGSLGAIRDTLTELSTTIPVAFTELANTATLGNQLGIATEDLAAFTETVTAFSTVTGISIDASAQAFGKLGNLLGVSAQDYDRLASAISYAGRTTAATEAQIISIAQEIAPAAASAGFAADEVVGLSAALGSIRVPPERSRSTILQFFETLNTAVANGGTDLQNFATVVGVTASELEQMVRSGRGQDILSQFVGNVSTADTVQITQALQELGLAGLRTNPTIRALKDNSDLLATSLSNSGKAFRENTELQYQMEFILDDLATKWQTTVNAIVNFSAALGSQVAPVVGILLDNIKQLVIGLTEFINTPVGGAVARVVAVLAGAAAAFAAYRGAVALATATTFALVTAQKGLAAAGVTSALGGLASALGLVSGASGTAAAGLTVVRTAMIRLLAATGVGAVLVLLGSAIVDLRGTLQGLVGFMQASYNTVGKYFTGLRTFVGVLAGVTNMFVDVTRAFAVGNAVLSVSTNLASRSFEVLGQRIALTARGVSIAIDAIVRKFGVLGMAAKVVLRPLTDSVQKFGEGFQAGAGFIDNNVNMAFDQLNNLIGMLPTTLDDGTGAVDDLTGSLGGLDGGLGDVGSGLDTVSEKVRTLTDYTSDLQSVWDRAFQIRFDPQTTLDGIATKFQEMRDAAKETSQNIRQLQADLGLLNADLGAQQYFLGIAERYGDEKRAQALRAQIAKTQADIADKTADLNAEQQKNNRTLTGNTQAARDNRSTIIGLVKDYQGHVAALANSGLSTEELKRQTEQLRQDFINQATQLGFNRNELGRYAAAFTDVKVAIDNVPRNITVGFNADPAIQALNEFVAKAKEQMATAGGDIASSLSSAFANNPITAPLQLKIDYSYLMDQQSKVRASTGDRGFRIGMGAGGQGGQTFADGGYTGAGGKYEPAGIVHRGEYVIPKQYVNQATGLPHADALGRLQRGASGRRGYAGGGFVSGGGMSGHIASFGPMAAMQLAQALSTQLVLDSGAAAGAVNRQNAFASRLGSN